MILQYYIKASEKRYRYTLIESRQGWPHSDLRAISKAPETVKTMPMPLFGEQERLLEE